VRFGKTMEVNDLAAVFGTSRSTPIRSR
jgi:hypothetical protein